MSKFKLWIRSFFKPKYVPTKKAQFAEAYCKIRKIPYSLICGSHLDNTALVIDRRVVCNNLDTLSYHEIISLIDSKCIFSVTSDNYSIAKHKHIEKERA